MGCGYSRPKLPSGSDDESLRLSSSSGRLNNHVSPIYSPKNLSQIPIEAKDNLASIIKFDDENNSKEQVVLTTSEGIPSNLPRKIVVTQYLPLKFSQIKREATFYCSMSQNDADL